MSESSSLSSLPALFLLPPFAPPLPLPRALPLPLADVAGVELIVGVAPTPAVGAGAAVATTIFAPPLPLLLAADVGGGVEILSLVTMLFNTCSLAASYPGVPACADAFALTRFNISSVDAENCGNDGAGPLEVGPVALKTDCMGPKADVDFHGFAIGGAAVFAGWRAIAAGAEVAAALDIAALGGGCENDMLSSATVGNPKGVFHRE